MNKEEALKIILVCAKSYSENFVNCNLLFVACDKHKNVSFLDMFFQDCLDNTVTVDDFIFGRE